MVLVLDSKEFLDITESLLVHQWHCKDTEKAERLEKLRERVNKAFCSQVTDIQEETK